MEPAPSGTVETDGHMLAALVRRVTFNQLALPTSSQRTLSKRQY